MPSRGPCGLALPDPSGRIPLTLLILVAKSSCRNIWVLLTNRKSTPISSKVRTWSLRLAPGPESRCSNLSTAFSNRRRVNRRPWSLPISASSSRHLPAFCKHEKQRPANPRWGILEPQFVFQTPNGCCQVNANQPTDAIRPEQQIGSS